MNRWRTLCTRIRNLVRRRSADADMAAELQAHVDALAERYVARGMSPEEARFAALREFGGVEQIKERCRDERHLLWLENVARDFRGAVRRLLRAPGFASVCLVTLGLCIGLSTVAFSLTNALLYQSLPYPQSAQLVRVFRASRSSTNLGIAPGNFLDVSRMSSSFSQVAAFSAGVATLGSPGQPARQVPGLLVTANFLATLGVEPTLGRGFRANEDQPGHDVVILSHRLWLDQFAGDPTVIGQTVRFDGENVTIIGVLGENFQSMTWGSVEYLRPIVMTADAHRDRKAGWFNVVARLKPSITMSAAQTELTVIAQRLDQQYPLENRSDTFRVVDLRDSTVPAAGRAILWLLTGLAILVLIIACTNLAAVQFARALTRERECAVRAALGATRWRLVTPYVIESLLISALGSAIGLLLAHWAAGLLEQQLKIRANFPEMTVPLDWHVLLFVTAVTIVATLAFGLAPAWLAARRTTNDALKQSTHVISSTRRQQRLKHALVLAQLALATIVITTGAAFYVASHRFLHRDLGWTMDGLFTAGIGLPDQRYPGDQGVAAFQQKVIERLRAVPGVESVALTRALPLWSLGDDSRFVIDGAPPPPAGREPVAMVYSVTSDYFSTLRIALREGSGFSRHYAPGAPGVVLINESMARQFWPGESAIGKRLRFANTTEWMEVIGVTADVRMAIEFTPPRSRFQVYRPIEQAPLRYFRFVVRTSVVPNSVAPSIRRAIAELDPDLPLFDAMDLRKAIIESSPFSVVNAVQPAFISLALIIAMLGLYATLAQLAVQRTRDFGIRLALGARPADIRTLVILHAGRLIAVGGVLGILGAFAASRLLQHAMPEFGMPGLGFEFEVLVLLAAITLTASYLPARRASRIDPIMALRTE